MFHCQFDDSLVPLRGGTKTVFMITYIPPKDKIDASTITMDSELVHTDLDNNVEFDNSNTEQEVQFDKDNQFGFND